MRNLEDPRRNESLTTKDIAERSTRREAEIVRMDRREGAHAGSRQSFIPEDAAQELRTHWNEIQTNFVDEPRKSVEEADKLVASAIQRIAAVFSERRATLENKWSQGDQVSTEDLRISLQQYRDFFTRLLSI